MVKKHKELMHMSKISLEKTQLTYKNRPIDFENTLNSRLVNSCE
jgi:hypothetical protein